jgi:hypothetical protein
MELLVILPGGPGEASIVPSIFVRSSGRSSPGSCCPTTCAPIYIHIHGIILLLINGGTLPSNARTQLIEARTWLIDVSTNAGIFLSNDRSLLINAGILLSNARILLVARNLLSNASPNAISTKEFCSTTLSDFRPLYMD